MGVSGKALIDLSCGFLTNIKTHLLHRSIPEVATANEKDHPEGWLLTHTRRPCRFLVRPDDAGTRGHLDPLLGLRSLQNRRGCWRAEDARVWTGRLLACGALLLGFRLTVPVMRFDQTNFDPETLSP